MAVDPPCTAQLSMYKMEVAGAADCQIITLIFGLIVPPTVLRLFPQIILLLIFATVFCNNTPKPVLFAIVRFVSVALWAASHGIRPPP